MHLNQNEQRLEVITFIDVKRVISGGKQFPDEVNLLKFISVINWFLKRIINVV